MKYISILFSRCLSFSQYAIFIFIFLSFALLLFLKVVKIYIFCLSLICFFLVVFVYPCHLSLFPCFSFHHLQKTAHEADNHLEVRKTQTCWKSWQENSFTTYADLFFLLASRALWNNMKTHEHLTSPPFVWILFLS